MRTVAEERGKEENTCISKKKLEKLKLRWFTGDTNLSLQRQKDHIMVGFTNHWSRIQSTGEFMIGWPFGGLSAVLQCCGVA
jgi:hypothetical protein